jgi:putative PEP-CTERM system histidine kinase
LNPEHILLIVASLWALGLGLGALAKRPRTLTVWSFTIGMILLAADGSLALLMSRTAVFQDALQLEGIRLGVECALPAVWLTFSLGYSRGNARRFLRGWKGVLIAASLLPLAPAFGFEHLFAVDPRALEMGLQPPLQLAWLGRGVHLVLLVAAVLVLMNLERTYTAAVGTLRWRIKFVIIGLGLIFAARVYTSSQALLYSAAGLGLAAFNAGALIMGCLLISISFFRSSLSAVEVYPSLAVLEKSVTVLLAGAYLFVIGVLAKLMIYLGGDTTLPVQALFVLFALIGLGLLLASDRARFVVRRFVSRHFDRPFYDYRALWRTFNERTSSIVDEVAYARELANLISDSVQTLSVSVWLEQPGSGRMALAASTSLPQSDSVNSSGIDSCLDDATRYLAKHPEPFALEDSRETWVEELKKQNPDIFGKGGKRICIPLLGKGQLLGMLIIGDRVNGIPFSVEDFELFKSLGSQAASGLLNLQLTRQLLQAREMEAFQTMSAFFVHDLKNTASTLSLMLRNLPTHFEDPAFREDAFRAIGKSVERINDLIGRMTLLRQRLELQPIESDLNAVVTEALDSLKGVTGDGLVRSLTPLPKVLIDPAQIQKVVVNLLLNARDATGNAGEIRVETGHDDGWAALSVSDHGCGMSQEFVARSLFRPFQTTKKKGVGIGLFHSKMIVDAHRGRIEVKSDVGKGTTFRVLLPLKGDLK